MNNETSTATTASSDNDKVNTANIPIWIIALWAVPGFLLTLLVILVVFWSVRRRRILKQRLSAMEECKHEELSQDNTNQYAFQPREVINQFHGQPGNLRNVFPSSFVDHMRIPRAVEVKMVESVNALPQVDRASCPYNAGRELTSLDESFELSQAPLVGDKSLTALSREHSFRYLGTEESTRTEKLYREKLLVSELREKLKNQKILDSSD